MRGVLIAGALLQLLVLVRPAAGQGLPPQGAAAQNVAAQNATGQSGTLLGGQAPEIELRATAAAIYSDNVAHAATNPLSDTVLDALAGVRVDHIGPRLSADIDLSVAELDYLRGTSSSQTLPAGHVNVIGVMVPERFTWMVRDDVGQISNEPLNALDSLDRQNVNLLSTGPDVFLPLSTRNSLELQARYGTTNYQYTNIDSARYNGEVGLVRTLASNSTLALVQDYEKIDYKVSGIPSVDLAPSFLRYTLEARRTYFVAEGGSEWLRTDLGKRRTPHALLTLQRLISTRLTLNAEYQHGFSDAGDAFLESVTNRFTNGTYQNVQAVAGPFESDSAYAMLIRGAGRMLIAAEVTWNRENYQSNVALDRRVAGADLVVDYRLSSRLTLAGKARWRRETFPETGLADSGSEVSVGLNRQLTPYLQLAATYLRGHGAGNIILDRFTEDRVTLALIYASSSSRDRIFDPGAQFRFYQRPMRELSTPQSPTAPEQ